MLLLIIAAVVLGEILSASIYHLGNLIKVLKDLIFSNKLKYANVCKRLWFYMPGNIGF